MLIFHVVTTNPSSHCQLSTFLLSNSDIYDVSMLRHFSCVQLLVTLWMVACQTLLSDPMDGSLPDSSVHGILEARILEWVAMPFSRGSSPPRDQTHISYVSCIGRWVLYH